VKNLRAMGADVTELPDGLRISSTTKLHGAEIDSFGDHRIAMAFSVAALIADGETQIHGAESVAVSFPEFYELLNSLIES
jgi:3-phosphoshikimate 1-carboxyvinyltransferase